MPPPENPAVSGPHDPSDQDGDDGDGPEQSASGAEGAGRLVAVRHGATAWSLSLRHTGWTDIPLEPEGRDQAREVGRRLAGHRFARVLTSPLARAHETAALAGFADAEVCDDLREWDYGAYEGLTTAEIRRRAPDWSLWRDGVPDGESLAEVTRRADRLVAVVRAAAGDVLVFAHAHILRVIAARWIARPATEGARLVLSPATVSVLGWERETPVVERWNMTAGDPLA